MIIIDQLEGEPLVEAEEDQAPKDEEDQVGQEEDPVEVAENVQDFDESSRGDAQDEERQPPEPDPERPSTSSRTFRVNSPSYQAWLPDGYSRIFRSYVFGPSGLKDYGSATLRSKI